jgi:hypothetical protein
LIFTQQEIVMEKLIPYRTVARSAGCIALAKKGNFLYAAGGDFLSVYDVSLAEKPKLVWRRGGFGNGRQLAVAGSKLYLTAREFGLWILDIENPGSPSIMTRYDTVELATGIAVAGDIVFVTLRIYGVEILDCSDPYHPRHLSLIRTPEAQSAAYFDGLLYVGDWGAGCVTMLDVGDPVHPVRLSSAPLGGFGDGVAVADGICYAATGLNAKDEAVNELSGNGHGLDIFQIDGQKPLTHLSRISFPRLAVKTNDFWTVRLCGKTAFVADTHNGVFQVDVSDPYHPRCIGRVGLPGISRMDNRAEGRVRITVPDCAGDVAVGDRVIYIAGQKTGLHVAKTAAAYPEDEISRKIKWISFSVLKPESVKFISGMRCYNLGGQVRRLALDGDTLYAACSHAGIRFLHLNKNKVEETGRLPVACSYDVAVRDGKLYSAEGTDGMAVYSLDGSFRELGRWKMRGRTVQLLRLSGCGRFAVCGSRDGVLRILDVSDHSTIRLVLSHLHGGLLYGDTFPERDWNNIMPVIWPYCGLAWYDLSGEKPKLLRNDRTNCSAGQNEGITLLEGRFLLNTMDGRFQLLSPDNPGRPPEYCILANDGCAGVPSVDGEYVAFAHRRNGEILLYRFSPSGSAKRIPERCITGLYGTPDRVVFYKGRMLVPCGHQGLLIEEPSDNDGGDRK